MVGLNSGKEVFMLAPKFSTLTIVEDVIIFSFCGINFSAVSALGCALAQKNQRIKSVNAVCFFKGSGCCGKIKENNKPVHRTLTCGFYANCVK